jgi:uncharacterized protein (TIGR02145 family)
VLYTETHSPTTSKQGVVSVIIGTGTQVGDSAFTSIPWRAGNVFIKLEIDPNGTTSYTPMGDPTKLMSVPYALYADNTKEVTSQPNAADDEPIFVVRNKEGKIVFAVYQTGVRVYVEDSPILKGAKGGFAVGGLSNQAKDEVEYFRITSDSARIFMNERSTNKGAKGGFAVGGLSNLSKATPQSLMFIGTDSTRFYIKDATGLKGAKGGFAVGGLSNLSKGASYDLFSVTTDSTRIYINDSTTNKGAKGGFAVGGLSNLSKGSKNEFMRISRDSARIYVDNSITPKGAKGGFAVGGLSNLSKGTTGNFLDLTPQNSFIGQDAGKSNTTGNRNAFIGYQAGIMNSDGYDNVFIGNTAGLSNSSGMDNIFIGTGSGKSNTFGQRNIFLGTSSGVQNTTGIQNIAIGSQAGFSLQTGMKNIFIGTVAGFSNVNGIDNVFIGNFAGNRNNGSSNVFIGRASGVNNTIGTNNVFIGEQTGKSNIEGCGNVFLGDQAGINEKGSNRLYISNSSASNPLIYGEFDNGKTVLNSYVKIGDLLNLNPRAEYPGNPSAGDVFFDGSDHQLKLFDGTQWRVIQTTLATNLPPTVSILNIPSFNTLYSSCSIECNIASDGGSTISEQGICYNTSPFFDRTNSNDIPYSTTGIGNYTVSITGLAQNISYYVRAYATNGTTSALGDLKMFTTPSASALPTVITNPVYSNNQTSASGSGVVTLPGGLAVTAYGLCWNTSPNPTIANSKTSEIVSNSSFVSSITELSSGITYYLRAYATNLNGTSYGNEVIFKTMPEDTSISDVDGNVYNILQIGTQTWMKENLKTTKYSDGNSITNVTDNTAWKTQVTGAYCWYNNDETTNKNIYGALYNIYAVVDSRNLCPTGWHVPSDVEWDVLRSYLGTYEIVGGKLKEAGTTHWKAPNYGADNSAGFTALPGGARSTGFSNITYSGFYWTSTRYSTYSNAIILLNTSSVFTWGNYVNYYGFSVRCVKD